MNLDKLAAVFEPALLQEIRDQGTWQNLKEGDLIMDYGKYIRMMPIIVEGKLKVLRLDENGNEILLYYLSSSESCQWRIVVAWKLKKVK
jgi:CRP/FNR family transcriptional regulator, anaerobic regulatory protein